MLQQGKFLPALVIHQNIPAGWNVQK